MATAETDLDKPTDVVCKKRSVIHPERFITVKPKGWTKIFGSHKTYIDSGDITQPPTQTEIDNYMKDHNVTIRGN